MSFGVFSRLVRGASGWFLRHIASTIDQFADKNTPRELRNREEKTQKISRLRSRPQVKSLYSTDRSGYE